jgi:hypothetical protein
MRETGNLKQTGKLRAQANRFQVGGWLLAGAFALVSASLVSSALAEDGKGAAKAGEPIVADAAPITQQQAEFFETNVRPLLFNKCFGCHNAKSQMGSLRLDSLDAMLKGGGGGPAILPGNVDKSHLIQAIHYDGTLKMPPSGKLKDNEIAALTEWVKMGAPWPGAKVSDAARAAQKGEYVPTDNQKNWWSFQTIKNPVLPAVKNGAWCQNPIDRFVLARLEAKGLKPAPSADRRTLLRRASIDLMGLPPTPEETDAFVNDKSPGAWEKVVDRLLASPRYGERWARHWLDVARYADTKGYVFVEDAAFHNAYTYRDWVINAFNKDMPYDQFVIDQLAADLAAPNDRSAQAATGFVTLGRRFLNDGQLINDDRIDTTSRGLMGLTVACARCHDHKFDPIPTKDYYALYSVFDRTSENTVPISPDNISKPYEEFLKKLQAAQNEKDEITRVQVKRLRGMIATSPAGVPDKSKAVLQSLREDTLPDGNQLATLLPVFETAERDHINALQATITDLNKHKPATPEFGMALKDNGNNGEQHVFKRGNAGNQGDVVPRRFLTILSTTTPKTLPPTGSGRLELARYIASRDNPLTSRVFVNRVWLYHFGQGLVRTPSDFGLRGEKPTHPELLDWLAYHFTEDWSVKKLQKLILLSNTYKMSSDAIVPERARAFAADPENRLLWKQNRQRLDLESLRDSLLWASGKLDTTPFGPAVELTTMPYTNRRTIYGLVNRNNLQGLYRTFDFATPDSSNAQRINTSVPQQALFLMNSPFVVQQAQALAQLPDVAAPKDESGRLRALYRRLFGRAPSVDELAIGAAFLRQPTSGAADTTPVSPWQYGWGEIDAKSGHVVGFTPFTHFANQQWQASATFPDPKLSFLSLNARGGHPGADMQHTVIRRWIAPVDATVSVGGELNHPDTHGDGVRAHVISARMGELGQWTAFHSKAATTVAQIVVKKGDTLDFVVDCRGDQGYDSFVWTPVIRIVAGSGPRLVANAPAANSAQTTQTWDAGADFSGPPAPLPAALSNWERYVQALLLTNEFNFVD